MTTSEAKREGWSVGSMLASLLAARYDPAARIRNVDLLAVLIALLLPWSTSGVAIGGVVLLIALLWTLELRAFAQLLKRPICWLPIALFGLAAVGTLWSDAPWGTRIHALSPVAKLLVLPFLLYHFERSSRGMWVFIAFLISCTLLMVVSWIVMFDPGLALKTTDDGVSRGIFVKNYINQSQEFALCAVALAYPVVMFLRAKRIWPALLLAAIGMSFLANMAFVIVSRTALVTIPFMAAVFGLLHLRLRTNLMILATAIFVAAAAWAVSPQLETALKRFTVEYQGYQAGRATSIAERIEYWKNALRFFADAPLVGHGTGSIQGLYEKAASGPEWIAGARVVPNPHNQTLNVAVQWGVIGIVVLYAMWICHLLLFRGEGIASWIGLLVVVQNIFTSLFNSHLFDFHEGWMYVLGVGVAGGLVLKTHAGARGLASAGAGRDKRDGLLATAEPASK
jgi:O-antigen ligase